MKKIKGYNNNSGYTFNKIIKLKGQLCLYFSYLSALLDVSSIQIRFRPVLPFARSLYAPQYIYSLDTIG